MRPTLSRGLSGLSFGGLCLAGLCLAGPAFAQVPRVVTDMPATQSLVAQVMGKLGTPSILLAPGADPHSYQMRPSEARALEQSGLVIWMGPEMTPWLEHALEAGSKTRTEITLLKVDGTHTRRFAGDGDDDEEDGHGHDHGAADTDADGLMLDPHAFLDPQNAALWLGAIAGALGQADPENAATYAANAKAAQADLAALDAKLTQKLAPLAGRGFVTYHDAYGYFAEHYGLDDAGWVSPGDATDPGAAHLKALRAELVQKGVVCAFPEAGHDPRPLERLTEGTKVRMGGMLDPEGLAHDRGPGLYAKTLETLADTLAECLREN